MARGEGGGAEGKRFKRFMFFICMLMGVYTECKGRSEFSETSRKLTSRSLLVYTALVSQPTGAGQRGSQKSKSSSKNQ